VTSGRSTKPVVAVAQVAPAFLDLEGSLARAADAIAAAGREGADLVVFSEAWLCGYPIWVDRGVAWEDATAKRLFARLHQNAVELRGEPLRRLCAAARRARVDVALGANERAGSQGTIMNSIVYLSRSGEIAGVHRKLVPTHSERVVWGQGDGSTLTVVDAEPGRVGGLVCWEHWMPLARQAMHAKREQIHVALWPDMPEMHHVASRAYAFEGRCFVACAGGILPLDALPADLEGRDVLAGMAKDGMLLAGGSGIVGPDGEWLVGPVFGEERIIAAELDLVRIVEESQSFDANGHYSRPDVFRLSVDEQPRASVAFERP
jgi:nitrilase